MLLELTIAIAVCDCCNCALVFGDVAVVRSCLLVFGYAAVCCCLLFAAGVLFVVRSLLSAVVIRSCVLLLLLDALRDRKLFVVCCWLSLLFAAVCC